MEEWHVSDRCRQGLRWSRENMPVGQRRSSCRYHRPAAALIIVCIDIQYTNSKIPAAILITVRIIVLLAVSIAILIKMLIVVLMVIAISIAVRARIFAVHLCLLVAWDSLLNEQSLMPNISQNRLKLPITLGQPNRRDFSFVDWYWCFLDNQVSLKGLWFIKHVEKSARSITSEKPRMQRSSSQYHIHPNYYNYAS